MYVIRHSMSNILITLRNQNRVTHGSGDRGEISRTYSSFLEGDRPGGGGMVSRGYPLYICIYPSR